jgi:arylsulfatase A-like enzyme
MFARMHRARRNIAGLGAPLAAGLALAAACRKDEAAGPAPAPPRGSVLVITLDTTRADRLGCYGDARAKTPNLDRIATEGTLFEHAYTPIPSTFPSHSTIFTGLYPRSHGVHDNAVYVLAPERTTLAERLHERGFATGAFVSAFVLDSQFGLDQGFDVYDDEVDRPLYAGDAARVAATAEAERKRWEATLASAFQRRGDVTTDHALAWLKERGRAPFFLWVHLFDAHQPYQPPPPFDREFDPGYSGRMDGDARRFWQARAEGTLKRADVEHMQALYAGEIAFLDVQVGRLLDGLRAGGRLDDTLVVVVADHGEGLGEHQQIFEHNSELYEEAVRVPLLVRRPDASARGERVAALARTLDVAPTILEWLGLAVPSEMQGVSLLPFTDAAKERRDRAAGADEILLEALRERQINPVEHSLLGLRGPTLKAILTTAADGSVARTEVYDLDADPTERRDLAGTRPDRAAKLGERALALQRELPVPGGDCGRELSAIDNAALRALGYGGK